MEAKGLTPILNVSDIASTFAWFENWGWKKLWDWGTPAILAQSDGARRLALCSVRARKEAAAEARTPPRFRWTETKKATREFGCGSTTLTPCTNTASLAEWRSPVHPPTCPGTFARCTFAIPTAMYSVSARD